MWELTKSFRFEAAHALAGTTLGEASQDIHGHSFRADVTVRGTPDPATGMVKMPNVNSLVELMDMREAQRSYEANLGMIEQDRSMVNATIDLLRR